MGLKPRPEYTPRISVGLAYLTCRLGMMLRRDIPQAGRGSVDSAFHCGILHFGLVTSSELLTLVTDHSRIFGSDDFKRATMAHPKGQTH